MIVPTPFQDRTSELIPKPGYTLGSFFAMGCPCEVLMETEDAALTQRLLDTVQDETWRLEALWSRYLETSLVQQLNARPAQPKDMDAETSALLVYCEQLWELSDGAFDITSGVLRRLWTFDGEQRGLPNQAQVDEVLQLVGWSKVNWAPPRLQMREGMQIDFGGVGKEYAVDRCCSLLQQQTQISCLVNFGGDCAVTHQPKNKNGWQVGIENVSNPGQASEVLTLRTGAVASSGSTHRYLRHNGKRLSHILNAKTGYPIEDAPLSVTVQAATCLEAGMLATLASLRGKQAQAFLEAEGITAFLQEDIQN
jgi:thiamine biosynthesis lipoprotein